MRSLCSVVNNVGLIATDCNCVLEGSSLPTKKGGGRTFTKTSTEVSLGGNLKGLASLSSTILISGDSTSVSHNAPVVKDDPRVRRKVRTETRRVLQDSVTPRGPGGT